MTRISDTVEEVSHGDSFAVGARYISAFSIGSQLIEFVHSDADEPGADPDLTALGDKRKNDVVVTTGNFFWWFFHR